MWSCRHPSLRGKVTVIHILVISQLEYTSAVLFVPKWVVEKVQKMLHKFLCNAKKPKIKDVTGKLEDRGLKIPDFESQVKSMKKARIQKIFDRSKQAWKQVLKVSSCVNDKMLPFYQTKPNHLPNILSNVFKEVF